MNPINIIISLISTFLYVLIIIYVIYLFII
uniref:Uncharacterized protein n=1 Tax=viral metagenome TaxID=1070528 RepID=A0A6C0LGW4_9ZZZZ